MGMFELRDDRRVDLPALAQLRARCEFAHHPADYLQRQIDGAHRVVHAYAAGRLVGFARAISDGVSTAYLNNMMVDPDHRRRGIGRALVEHLLRDADGIKFVLHTRPGPAAAFWAALGFAPATDMMVRDRATSRRSAS
jgi:GNAT superfamily N-acetyltransferase